MQKFEELNEKNNIENKLLMNMVSDLANVTGDKGFKILEETMRIKNNLNKLSDPLKLYEKGLVIDKDKIINFLQQINKLIDDFIKEMDINE